MRIFDKWNIFLVLFLFLILSLLNYFNIVPIYKTFSFLSFLPHAPFEKPVEQPTLTPAQTLPVWQPAKKLIEEKKIPSPQRILEVNLFYDQNATLNVRIASVNIKNGYSPKYPSQEEGYELRVLDKENKIINILKFSVPRVMIEDFSGQTIEQNQQDANSKVNFTLTIPYIEFSKNLQILDPEGKTLETKDLLNIPVIDNKPNFDSIHGYNLPDKQSSLLDFIFPKAFARSAFNGKLDIAIIGDGFDNIDEFHEEADRMIKGFLEIEPFKTRASQIQFYRVDNFKISECPKTFSPSANIFRGSGCHSFAVQAVNNSGTPYDKIYVLANDKMFGGASEQANGMVAWGALGTAEGLKNSSTIIFAHELGHLLGLYDEYITGNARSRSMVTDEIVANCFAGTPTRDVWIDIPVSEYRQGCTSDAWWRSSEYSIMNAGQLSSSFNLVSQRIINEKLNLYAGKYVEDKYANVIPTFSPTPILQISSPNLPVPTSFNLPDDACSLSVTPLTGYAPLTVEFKAEEPKIEGYTFDRYQWDFDGDGIFDTGVSAGNPISHTYIDSGVYKLRYVYTYFNNDSLTDVNCDSIYDKNIPTITVLEPSIPTPTIAIDTYKQCIFNCTARDPRLCPSLCGATPTSIIATVPVLSLNQEIPTSVPTAISQKTIYSITINGQSVDLNNPFAVIHLSGVEGIAGVYVVPVVVTYFDGSTKEIPLVFDYKQVLVPTVTPMPIFIPTAIKCVVKYGDDCQANIQGVMTEGSIDCNGLCVAPTPTSIPASSAASPTPQSYSTPSYQTPASSISNYSCTINFYRFIGACGGAISGTKTYCSKTNVSQSCNNDTKAAIDCIPSSCTP